MEKLVSLVFSIVLSAGHEAYREIEGSCVVEGQWVA